MGKLISLNQSTFLKGGGISVGNMVVVNELVDLSKKSKRAYVILKVDFEKSYDSIS